MKNYLGDIIKGFKSAVTRQARERGYEKFEWQARYWDRIIRDQKELDNIRQYVEENPLKWAFEKEGYEGK